MPTLRPSSAAYSTLIRPDHRLRRLVLGSAALGTGLGALIVLELPLAPALCRLAAVAWLAAGLAGLAKTGQAYRLNFAYRIFGDGSVEVLTAGGGTRAATIAAGSRLEERLGWLRFRAADGSCWGELVAGNSRKNKAWRRLRVIFRQLRAC